MKKLGFEGSGEEYFKIWIVNILLVGLTLGLYYPWAKVRNHRYFYGNSVLEGRNFEYHATGKQLFFSFLIAMALFITYLVIKKISPAGSLILLFVLFLALPWVVWRSLMFRMRVTSFSNVRFSFAGKLSGAYITFLLLPLILLVAVYGIPIAAVIQSQQASDLPSYFGVIVAVSIIGAIVVGFYFFAVIQQRTMSYMINGYRYGQGVFSTELTAWGFAKITLKTIGLSFLSLLVVMIVMGALAAIMGIGAAFTDLQKIGATENPEELIASMLTGGFVIVVIVLTYFSMILVSFFLMAYAQTRKRTYILENTLIDNKIAFVSTLKARSLAWVMVSNFFLVAFTLGLATPWAKVRVARVMLENTGVDIKTADFDDYITQQQDAESSLGEQLGDAFDIDLGVAI